jgi:hypothetical protein
LREEKFFAAYRRGIFDAFGDRRFHIGSPDLADVLKKRLQYGRQRFRAAVKSGAVEATEGEAADIDTLLRKLIFSIDKNDSIVRMLACVSNGDMRYALDMFRAFVTSGNTNVDKIIEIAALRSYVVPFHEFAKSAILNARKYFRSNVSHIVNVFTKSGARGASHMTALRLLARLSAAESAASAHGAGFVDVSKLLREFRESFGSAADMIAWANELLRRGLLQSEPPKAGDLTSTDALRIAAAGAYYWKYLVGSFAYIDLMVVDTPVADEELARSLAAIADSRSFDDRFSTGPHVS